MRIPAMLRPLGAALALSAVACSDLPAEYAELGPAIDRGGGAYEEVAEGALELRHHEGPLGVEELHAYYAAAFEDAAWMPSLPVERGAVASQFAKDRQRADLRCWQDAAGDRDRLCRIDLR